MTKETQKWMGVIEAYFASQSSLSPEKFGFGTTPEESQMYAVFDSLYRLVHAKFFTGPYKTGRKAWKCMQLGDDRVVSPATVTGVNGVVWEYMEEEFPDLHLPQEEI